MPGRLAGGHEVLPRQPRAEAVGAQQRVEAAPGAHLAAARARRRSRAPRRRRRPGPRCRRRSAPAPARRRPAARDRTVPPAGARSRGPRGRWRRSSPARAPAAPGAGRSRAKEGVPRPFRWHEATDLARLAVWERREMGRTCAIRSAHDPYGEDREPADRRAAAADHPGVHRRVLERGGRPARPRGGARDVPADRPRRDGRLSPHAHPPLVPDLQARRVLLRRRRARWRSRGRSSTGSPTTASTMPTPTRRAIRTRPTSARARA